MTKEEAIEVYKELINPRIKEAFETFAPELAESEDKRIRKDIVEAVELYKDFTQKRKERIYIWLEKQGEPTDIPNDAVLDGNKDGLIADTIQSKPKFKTGDWVIDNNIKTPFLITDTSNGKYDVVSIYGSDLAFSFNEVERFYHLWTIQEAKDGDVLATKDAVFIFKHIDKTGLSLCKSYCEVIGNSELGLGFDFSINDVYPATKEQRDLLFQKMKEAGYEWNADKKELKKIEQKPNFDVEIPFGAKDSELEEVSYSIPNGYHAEIKDNKVVIKKGGQKSIEWIRELEEKLSNATPEQLAEWKEKYFKEEHAEWSEEDEEMVGRIIEASFDYYDKKKEDKIYAWLESLKNRVQPQPKQEWSEEDERMLGAAYDLVTTNPRYMAKKSISRENVITWLKSLKDRYAWKPSDEKMEFLAKAITTLGDEGDCKTALILNDLRFELKKLKGNKL